MRQRKRDSSFLFIAAIAALGGTLAIVLSIGLPIWSRLHGASVTPAFSLFAGWGVAAMLGAYASLRTYFVSEDPSGPPRGGARLTLVPKAEAVQAPLPTTAPSHKQAA
jgi:hypothetical protein